MKYWCISLCTFHRWGDLVFIVYVFSQLDGDKDSLLLDGGFSFLIAVKLIRDNWKAVIGNYPTSLIGEIWFDLQDKQLLGIIILPLFVRFGLIYRIWALVLGLYLGDVRSIASIGPIFNPILGLRFGPAHLLFQTSSLCHGGFFFFLTLNALIRI